jgi:hypothetical protein
MLLSSVANFLVPDWGDKVDSGIGLSYGTARLHRLAGRYDNAMPESTISPCQGLGIRLPGSYTTVRHHVPQKRTYLSSQKLKLISQGHHTSGVQNLPEHPIL